MAEINGKSLLILGYGREGRVTHSFLLAQYPSLKIGVADRNDISLIPGAPSSTEVYSGAGYLEHVEEYDTIVHSPGMILKELLPPSLLSSNRVTSATNIFFSLCPGKIIGVTGTKGKSTTSSLIAHLLSPIKQDLRYGGNIGLPMLSLLGGATKETLFVLELSSYQLEDLKFSPHISVLLNIMPEHLDHHGSFEAYCKAKGNITAHQLQNDILIANLSNNNLQSIISMSQAVKIAASTQRVPGSLCWIEDNSLLAEPEPGRRTLVMPLSQQRLLGDGNRENIVAAATCALHLGLPVELVRSQLSTFAPLEHRLEKVGTFNGVTFIDDTLSTIPEALINALSAFSGRAHTVIAGGFDRGIDYSKLGQVIVDAGVKALVLFQTTGEKIAESTRSIAGNKVNIQFASSMDEAVKLAASVTPPETTCLLSPASSSFNMFRDYKDRGEQFKKAVLSLSARDLI